MARSASLWLSNVIMASQIINVESIGYAVRIYDSIEAVDYPVAPLPDGSMKAAGRIFIVDPTDGLIEIVNGQYKPIEPKDGEPVYDPATKIVTAIRLPKPGATRTKPKIQIQTNDNGYGAAGKRLVAWEPKSAVDNGITKVYTAILEDLTILEEIHKDLLGAWNKANGPRQVPQGAAYHSSAVAAYEAQKAARMAKPAETVATPVQAQTVKRQGRGGR